MALSLGELFQQTSLAVSRALNSRGNTSALSQRRVEPFAARPQSLRFNGCGSLQRSNSNLLSPPKAASHRWKSNPLASESGTRNSESGPVRVRAGPESATPVKPNPKRYPGENKGFVEEMRFVAMKLHTKDQATEGEKKADVEPVAKWEPTVEGFIKFLVNSKRVYDCMEEIVATAAHPSYALFRNTGLERSAALAKDLEWFRSEGHEIPEPSEEGNSYAELLQTLSESDAPAFICHFYNVYFAHSAGGRFIGQKVSESILNGKVLEFYKWEGELPKLLADVKKNLNKVAENWTREEKNHCLDETELSFKNSGKILRLIIS